MDKVDVTGNAGQDNAFTEAHIENGGIYPQAREVIHNHYYNNGHPFISDTDLSSPSLVGTYHLYVTHEAIGVSRLLRQAKKHIVLHAAFYPKYADGEQGDDIRKVMEESQDLRLKVIFTDLKAPWVNEFAVLLREKFSDIKKFEKEINDDKENFIELQENPKIGRDRVEICDSARLPLFPVILIDDTLIVGHYAHSREIAPNGLWLTIQHPKIPVMYKNLLDGKRPDCYTSEECAIIRYLEELIIY